MINFYTLTWLDGSIYLLRHGLILKLTKKSNLVWLHFTPTKLEHRRNTWCFPNLFCVIQTKKSQSWWNGIDFKVKEEKVSSKNLEQKGGGGERRGGEWERREQARSDECSVVVTVVTLGIFPPQTQDGGSTGSGATDQLWARHQVRIVSALCMSVDPPVSSGGLSQRCRLTASPSPPVQRLFTASRSSSRAFPSPVTQTRTPETGSLRMTTTRRITRSPTPTPSYTCSK